MQARNDRTICIGYDPREQAAYAVCRASVHRHIDCYTIPIVLDKVIKQGLYTRPTEERAGALYDVISEHPMSTEFAISRFLTPELARQARPRREKIGWALFMDCDMLVRRSMVPLFEMAEAQPEKAMFCVKHKHEPKPGLKMDGQLQSQYNRKNWSSVMLFNCDHPINRELTNGLINGVPGRDLHRFCWLGDGPTSDDLIGELHVKWNWLVGHSVKDVDPNIVHFTEGGPWLPSYKDVPFANEWVSELLYDGYGLAA